MNARATIRDIASEAGVSIATVSRVLNGRPDVAAETREAVLTVVRERGFSTNRSARALSGGRTGLVGLATPFIHGPYFASILSGAAEALYEQDTRIVVCSTHHHHDREVTLLDRLMHGTTDGAILLLPEETNEELLALHRQRFPFVVADPRVAVAEGIASVSAAHSSGARAATEHLLSLGHRRIGALTGPRGMLATEERLNGYHAALVAAGVVPDPTLEVPSNWQIEGGGEAALKLLDRRDRPTAVFAFNDNVAVGTMRAARRLGLRVPEDLSIVGFDDVEFAELLGPALTTVRQPLEEMGRMAVSLLTRLIEQQPVEALRVELATRLVVRESTAPPSR
jgi:LacI family transcriptional regulator, galactose operon repressor